MNTYRINELTGITSTLCSTRPGRKLNLQKPPRKSRPMEPQPIPPHGTPNLSTTLITIAKLDQNDIGESLKYKNYRRMAYVEVVGMYL
uniref:Uncharacterized protein n=1 Tax=Heterorhabditis bacteriophora TaxID=37862 RepID=A0A1I7XFV6_HETBA